jgi:putative ABC transport system ATP-binding protein
MNSPQQAAHATVVSLQGLRFQWPGAHHATVDIETLTLRAGDTLLLHGPSGCGKSSLLTLVCGVMLPDSGEASVMGVSWRSLSAARRDQWRADHIGQIFQQFNLLPYLSAVDNVTLPCRFSPQRRRRCEQSGTSVTQSAHELLDSMGLPRDRWHAPAAELSIGQQQRVAAARALIGNPPLIVADEPTSALDDHHRESFMSTLMSRAQAHGSAVLMVSHDLRLAPHFERQVLWGQWPQGVLA